MLQALSRELGELSSKHASLLQQLAECQGRVGELQQEAAGLQEQEGQGEGCGCCCCLMLGTRRCIFVMLSTTSSCVG
jgi:hypothetical protein